MASIDTIVNHNEEQSSALSKQDHSSDETSEKHPYSCKRCRRLKKKCTRTMPECFNCRKASEPCKYAPRAPRRKRIEVLKSFNSLRSKNQQFFPPPLLAASIDDPNRHSSTGPLLNDQASDYVQYEYLAHQTQPGTVIPPALPNSMRNNPSYPDFNSLSQSLTQQPLLNPSQFQQNNRSYIFGTLPSIRPLSIRGYQIPHPASFSQRSLPPQQDSSLLSRPQMSVPQQQQQQPIPPCNYTETSSNNEAPGAPLVRTESRQAPSKRRKVQTNNYSDSNPALSYQPFNSFSSDSKSNASVEVADETQQQFQGHILSSLVDYEGSSSDEGDIAPVDIDYGLHRQCVDVFFSMFGKFTPYFNQKKHIERFQTIGMASIDKLHPRHSFDLFMVFYIGYCMLEKHDKIPVDDSLKKYLTKKSLGQLQKAITSYNELSTVKNLLLFAFYTIFENSGSSSWQVSGFLTRLVLNQGLNRKSLNFEESPEEIERKNRIFWSVYNFDCWISTALARRNSIDDDDISTPYPSPLPNEDPFEMEIFKIQLVLRRLENDIYKQVHCVNAGNKNPTQGSKFRILESLRARIDDWYNKAGLIVETNHAKISYCAVEWDAMSHNYMLMSLYSPSFLVPNPSHEILRFVSDSCLKFLHHSTVLHQIKVLPLNWIMLYKYLHAFSPLLFCLCHEAADLVKTRTGLSSALEILEDYSGQWPTVSVSKDLFKRIIKDMDEIHDRRMLVEKFYEYASSFHDAIQNSDLCFGVDHPVSISN